MKDYYLALNRAHLNTGISVLRSSLFFLTVLFLPSLSWSQTIISGITTNSVAGTPVTTLVTSPDDAGNDIDDLTNYNVRYGTGGASSNIKVSSYTVSATTYDRFLSPDTLVLNRRLANDRLVNIWYTLSSIATGPDPDELNVIPNIVPEADAIYLSGNLNAGYDNILVNDDDLAQGSIQVETERVDVIWFQGIQTSSPTTAVFPIIERGGNDNIAIAAITSLNADGTPASYGTVIGIPETFWTGGGPSYDNYLILRRETVGQDPIPLLNIGTIVPQAAQSILGVAVSFQELGVSANQSIYGYSLFAADLFTGFVTNTNDVLSTGAQTVKGGIDLTDISTFPTDTRSGDSGLDLVAGVSAAVASDDNLIETKGPGGYKAALATWLKANEGAFVSSGGAASTEGNNVGFWEDQSVGNNDFTTLGTAPTFRSTTSSINFNPTVDFIENLERGLLLPDDEDYNVITGNPGYTKKSINIAFRTNANDVTTRQQIFEQGGGTNGLGIYIDGGNIYGSVWNRGSNGTGSPFNASTPTLFESASISTNTEYILTLEFDGNSAITGQVRVYLNGASIGTLSNAGILFNHTDDIGLGDINGGSRYHDGTTAASSFDGEISEFIYCNEPASILSGVRNRIESYLAIKYGITLDQSSPINYYNSNGDIIFNTTQVASLGGYLEYNNDIAGIGRDDASELDQPASRSENTGSVVTIDRGATISSNDTWLIWGNDAGALTESSILTMPDTIESRLERVWRVAERNEVLTTSVSFDLTGLGLSTNASDFSLLIADNSSGADFSNATVITGGVLVGSTITFSGVNLDDGQYFTLGTDYFQCSPGGVETNLALWLRADAGTSSTVNATEVTSWADQTGNNNATGTTGTVPDYLSNSINFNPALDFDGGSEVLTSTGGFSSNAYYLVLIPDDNITSASGFQVPLGFDDSSISPTNSIGGFTFGNLYGVVDDIIGHIAGNGAVGFGVREDNVSKTIASGVPLMFEVRENAGATGATILENGLLINNATNGSYLAVSNEEYTIGRFETPNSFSLNGFFDGKIGEIISYSSRPSDAESDRIQSYLAIKYGITLDQTSAQDYVNSAGTTIWNATTNATYNNDIAGIGRDDLSCLEQKQSTSQNAGSIVTMGLGTIAATNAANPNSFADDGDFLIWGDDGDDATQANANTVDVPGIVTERMERIWKVQDTGNTGATTIQFDINGLGYSSNVSDFNLIISNTSTMASGTVIPAASLVGGILTFNNIDLTDGQFFTIGTARTACGPGGVQTSIQLWLRADAGTNSSVNGASITSWQDQTVNSNNASATNAPVYNVNNNNFNPSIDFIAANSDVMQIPDGANDSPDQQALFLVGSISASSNNWAPFIIKTSSFDWINGWGFARNNATTTMYYHKDSYSANSNGGDYANQTIAYDQTYIHLGYKDASNYYYSLNNGSPNIDVPGSSFQSSNNVTFIGASPNGTGAGNNTTPTAFLNGSISEIIMFSDDLTSAERDRVSSYLAIKYGVTLNNGAGGTAGDYTRADGTLIWDASDYSGYHNDVAGIGRDDDACFAQKQSSSINSDDILTIGLGSVAATNAENANSFADNGDYLLWGNDNGATAQASAETTDVPTLIAERMTRIWRVNDTGAVGNTEIQFDLTGLGYSSNQEDFALLVGNTATMADATIITGGTLNGNILSFSDIDLLDGQYFTIATSYVTCGPGGVNTNIAVWLRADEEAYSDAGTTLATNTQDVLQWNDQSSPQNNAVIETLGGLAPIEPTFRTSQINFNPILRYTDPGTSNATYLKTSSNAVTGNFTMISVFQTTQNSGTDEDVLNSPALVSSRNAGSLDHAMGMQNGTIWVHADSDNGFEVQSTATYNNNFPHFATAVKNGTALSLFVDAASVATGTGTATLSNATGFGIGNHFNEDLEAQYAGDIAETIVFSSALSSEERNRVESYISLKYGLTKNSADDVATGSVDERDYRAADGGIIWDYDGQGTTYYNDIFGIGRDDLSCFEQTTSKSENSDALVTFNIPGGFGTNDSFIISGNDNAAIENPDNEEYNSSQVQSRLNREWRVQETGTVGSIEVTFDLATITGPLGVGTNNLSLLRLMVDDDGDFTSGTTLISPTSFNGTNNTVTFTVNFTNGQYYTLGSEEVAALPITLISFNAKVIDENVKLTWATASEENNSFFTVERSSNGFEFETLAMIDGAGTSSSLQNYQYIDNSPLQGFSYYRLKQTDLNGEFDYSELRSVFFDLKKEDVYTLYPNPVNEGDNAYIRYKVDQNKSVLIQVFNTTGRVVYTKEEVLSVREEIINIPTNSFGNGLVFIKITDQNNRSITLKLLVK